MTPVMPPAVWNADASAGISGGNHERQLAEWVYRFHRDGAVGTASWGAYGAWRNCAGGPRGIVAHDDWRWAASRFTEGSMAAYYENGDALDGARRIGATR